MKFKYIFLLVLSLAIIISVFANINDWIIILLIFIMYIFLIILGLLQVKNWIANKKTIEKENIKLNKDNCIIDVFLMLNIIFQIKHQYSIRSLILEYQYNKIVKINSLKDFLDSFVGLDRIYIYLPIAIIIFILLIIIKKRICYGIISANYILFSNGCKEDLSDFKNIKIEESFWGFSKKITFYKEKECGTVYIKTKYFLQVKVFLENITII